MKAIRIEYPEDCTEEDAIVYASGCFNQHQNDYKRFEVEDIKGYRNGTWLPFGDGRNAYFYRDMQGNYVLSIRTKENRHV